MAVKNISIIGAGKMSSILGAYFSKVGHKVHIGARETKNAEQLAKKIAFGVQGSSIKDAVQQGDIVFIAVPYLEIQDTIKLTGPLDGKIVVDICNPLKPDFSGLLISGETSAAEILAKSLPRAKVIKAFNTLFATVLERGSEYENNRAQIFYAGDDEPAKQQVAELISATGFEPVDTGKLSSARYLEHLTMLVLQIDSHLKNTVQITPAILMRPSI